MTFAHTSSRRITCLLALVVLLLCYLLRAVPGQAAGTVADSPEWAEPSVTTVERVSPMETSQNTPVMFSNTDCSLTTYHLTTSTAMQTGCFTETAYGLMDSDSGIVIFNGTDEGIPLLAASNSGSLLPWPGALDLAVITSQVTNGSAVSLYRNPLAGLNDHRDYLGRIDYKQLTKPPELPLKDIDGKPLIINPQTFAYSSNGAWAIAETVNGWFVRINLASLDVTRFAPSFTAPGISGALPSYDAISRDGHYVAVANASADAFKIFDLTNCSAAPCASHDYKPLLKGKIPGLSSVNHVRFINDSVLTFQARSTNSANSGIYEMAPSANIPHLTEYVGLGDSYTSGEGAFDYLAGTDSAENACHLSRNSYPLLLTHDLFSASGGHSVACSGAVLNDISSNDRLYRGQVKNGPTLQQLELEQPALLTSIKTNYLPGYIAQHLFVKDNLPRVATVSVGGNDIGFGSLLETCVAPHLSRHISDSTCFNTYEDRVELKDSIDRMVPKWTATYRELKADSPGVRLYVIGYPQIVDDEGSCAANVHLNKSELELSIETTDYLDAQIQKAAQAAGVPYVDISEALKGHRLCEAPSYDVAVNGLTAGTDAGVLGLKVFGHESYHPNALGQELMEQAILRVTDNLTSTNDEPLSANPSGPALIDAPKSGRVISAVIRTKFTSEQQAEPGQKILIHIPGPANGVPANMPFQIRLGGPSGKTIGTLPSGGDGSIDGTVTIPADTAAGDQPVDILGQSNDGKPLVITQPLQIGDASKDTGGSGVPDKADRCGIVADSGQDADDDGIDDSCDGFIGPAPIAPSTPSGTDTPSSDVAELPNAGSGSGELEPDGGSILTEAERTDTSALQATARTLELSQIPPANGKSGGALDPVTLTVSSSPTSNLTSHHVAVSSTHDGTVLSAHSAIFNPTINLPVPVKALPERTGTVAVAPAISLTPWSGLLVCTPLLFLVLGWLLGRSIPRKHYKVT
jgi:lysophospholipase L1-like esterase